MSQGCVGYDLPSTLHSRGTSLGYGRRQELVNTSCNSRLTVAHSPPPNAYRIKGAFEEALKKAKGYSFGASRKSYDKVFSKDSPYKDPCSPGPGEYYGAVPIFGKNANSFTMRPKTAARMRFINERAMESRPRLPRAVRLHPQRWHIEERALSPEQVP